MCVPALGAAQRPPPRTDPNVELALGQYRQGWVFMRSEQFEEAVVAFQKALELNPQLNLANYGLGRGYMALRRYQEAIRALATCRDNYLAQAGREFAGNYDARQVRQDRLTELQDLQRQYQTGPQTAQTQEAQRQIQNYIRETQNAASRGMNVSIEASVPAFVSLSLGSAYFRAERMEDAEREFKNTISVDSKSGEAHNNLAVVYFLTGRAPQALEEIKAAEKAGFRVNPNLKQQVKEAVGR